MLSLRAALQRVAQDWNDHGLCDLCDRCGRVPASKRCQEGTICGVCTASARMRAWRKGRARIVYLRGGSAMRAATEARGARKRHTPSVFWPRCSNQSAQ
jgi:hypothetical protein